MEEVSKNNQDESNQNQLSTSTSTITESTVVLTKSQIDNELNDQTDMDKSYQFETLINSQTADDVTKENETDSDQQVVTQEPSQTEKRDEVLNNSDDIKPKDDDKEDDDVDDFEMPTFNQVTSLNEAADNAVERVLNESGNGDGDGGLDSQLNDLKQNIENAMQTSETKENEVKPEPTQERLIENEKFLKILGNDSLMKKITAYGDENEDRPRPGQMVTIDYTAYIKDTDTLVEEEENYSFILGDNDVVSGLDMGVSLMFKNETSDLVCDSRHAYGEFGKEPTIEPNTSLIYHIKLTNYKDLTDFDQMDPIERMSLSESKKKRGNFNFNRKDFNGAIVSYTKGLKYFDVENLRGDESESDLEKFLQIRLTLLMNLSLCFYKLNDFRQALESLDKLLDAQPKHKKGLYIKGKVLAQIGELAEAIKCFSKSLELDPLNAEVKNELLKAQSKHKTQYEKEKRMYQKMLSGVSDNASSEKCRKLKTSSNNAYLGYVVAGVAVAVVSIGVAIFAKYKNFV